MNLYSHIMLLAVLALASCSPQPQIKNVAPRPPSPPITRPSNIIKPSPPTTVKNTTPPLKSPVTPRANTPSQRHSPLAYHQTTHNGIIISTVSYDDRAHQLRIADQPNGPGSRWLTAEQAAATYGALAAINGGFFTPQGKPLGLLIETGTPRGSLNKSSLGSGIFISPKGNPSIIRREVYTKKQTHWNAYNLLQTGPMLAENGQTISGLSKTNNRPRSFIAWDGQHHWMIGHASSCTLADLSLALAGRNLAGVTIKVSVNLDGGRSSDLWVSSRIQGGGKSHRGFLNKTVRNYLVLTPR